MIPAASGNPRCIMHLDMDAFYAAVEILDHPQWQGLPVIVAGLGPRGVVTTASYPARKFGVRSAIPTASARRLCPDGIYVQPRMARYAELSQAVMARIGQFSDQIETLSLDEAFVDLGPSLRLFGSGRQIATRLQQEILVHVGLSASIGIAPNKLIAKLASEAAKPGGIREIAEHEMRAFLDPLPLRAIWGVGEKMDAQLQALGLRSVTQLLAYPESALRSALGSFADTLRQRCLGVDARGIESAREELSISAEETFDRDLKDLSTLHRELMALSERVAQRLRASGKRAGLVRVKIRLPNFSLLTRQAPLAPVSDVTQRIHDLAWQLLQRWWQQQDSPQVRLLGVGVAEFARADQAGPDQAGPAQTAPVQADLFQDTAPRRGLDQIADALNARFGAHALRHARALRRAPDVPKS